MRERDIVHESGNYWVASERGSFTVYQTKLTHSVSDSSYAKTEDGKSLAIARCNYLAKHQLK